MNPNQNNHLKINLDNQHNRNNLMKKNQKISKSKKNNSKKSNNNYKVLRKLTLLMIQK